MISICNIGERVKKIYKILLLLLFANSSFAVTKVDITRSHIAPLPIAIAEFSGSKNLGDYIRNIVIKDLESTGLFRVIDKAAYIEKENIDSIPTFISWKTINASALVIGDIKESNQKISIHYKMWDVFSQKEAGNNNFSGASQENLRRIAHKISDDIYKKLTGEEGYFNTKISYVSLTKNPAGAVKRRIAIMDQDGHNHEYLTNSESLVLTPRISPSINNILYLSYENHLNPQVKSINIKTKSSNILGHFKGMSYAPRYVDNSRVLLSIVKNGISNIHLLNLDTMEQKQITNCTSICTSPSASPDKKQIVFNSDAGGSRQLYVMDFDGKNAERISFSNGYYSSPIWSPRGDLIAFTKIVPRKGFFIGVMRPDGSGERLITKGWLVDGASWAPNGRVLMFEKENGPQMGKQIYTIDITGSNERVLNTPHEAADPTWSNSLD